LVTPGSLPVDPCPDQNKISEAHVIGSPLDICLDNIVWFRVCPSTEYVHLTDAAGGIYNLPIHIVSHPQGPITIKHKCRAWGMVPRIAPGLAKVTGYIESYCPLLSPIYTGTVTIITQMPEMKLMVRLAP